jgi:hypothetical protein
MMPNDAYQRRLREWEEKERQRRQAMGEPPPYEPEKMRVKMPWGCIFGTIGFLAGMGYLFYSYFKIHF